MAHREVTTHRATTLDGWELDVCCARPLQRPPLGPVLIVPGYAMNTFALDHHPTGPSLAETLVVAGYEVWTLSLRGTSGARPRVTPPGPVDIQAYVRQDIPAALDVILRETAAGHRIWGIGTSLGGTLLYAYAALHGTAEVAGIVGLGSPLTWCDVHPLIRAAFASTRLARRLPVRGAGRVARGVMPALARAGLLGLYVNPRHLDPRDQQRVTATIEDPTATLNGDIAAWIRRGDLAIDGIDIRSALAQVEIPLLVVHGNRDGLVPASAALSAAEAWGGADVEIQQVGTSTDWFAHADLLVAKEAPRLVFDPIRRWLDTHAVSPSPEESELERQRTTAESSRGCSETESQGGPAHHEPPHCASSARAVLLRTDPKSAGG